MSMYLPAGNELYVTINGVYGYLEQIVYNNSKWEIKV